ncbi:MAG: peptidase M24 [Chitinophagales bacterium]|nr:MAG: peptidase M24 [Chitinophagales bacterium]
MHFGKIVVYLLVFPAILFAFLSRCNTPTSPEMQMPAPGNQDAQLQEAPGKFLYGIEVSELKLSKGKVRKGQFFADLLGAYDMDQRYLTALALRYKNVFDVRSLKAGRPYVVLKNSHEKPVYFIYEINITDYVVFDFVRDTVFMGYKKVELKRKTASGAITSSLYETFYEKGLHPELGLKLADIFAWVIDFYRLQKGDQFKVVYLERYVEGSPAGIEKILAARFIHAGNPFYAYYFQPDTTQPGDYFDEKANSLRKAFLKAPLKFGRISSRYSQSRLHPVLNKRKPHLGTDYAAPQGTPILAVGDGMVIEASYTKNNGNYVKIRHNSTYSTQYLHMSKFAKGIRPGAKVSQGQVIGYVGSTGLATGPHVCFRFWKNGQQVDHLRIHFPPSKPVDKKYIEHYHAVAQSLRKELDSF